MDSPNRKLYTTREKGFSFVTQSLEGVIDATYFNIMIMLLNIDLMKTWIPFLTQAEIKASTSPLRALFYQRYSPTWPISNREVFIEVSGFMLPHEEALAITMETVKGSWFGTTLTRNNDAEELFFDRCFAYIKPLGPNKTLFRLILNVNPGLAYVPDTLIDWGIKTVSGTFINYLVDQCTHMPSVYGEYMAKHREQFEDLKEYTQRMQKYDKLDIAEYLYTNFGIGEKGSFLH